MPHPVLTNGGTSAEWAIENPILPAGTTGTETNTGKTKLGNGTSYWNSLKYTDEPSGPDILALAVSNAIRDSDKDVNIGVDSSHNWGEQTAAEAGVGLHYFSDVGIGGSLFYNNGDNFMTVNTVKLLSSLVPCGIPPDFTVGENGSLTLGTALKETYSIANSNGLYLYFQADDVYSGSAAGLYYCVMSSTTLGTIYNNVYTSGNPIAPASPNPIVSASTGAHTTLTATTITLVSAHVKGGAMGKNGKLKCMFMVSNTRSAGTKVPTIDVAAKRIFSTSLTTSDKLFTTYVEFNNIGDEKKQIRTVLGTPAGVGTLVTSTTSFTNGDTTVDFNVIFAGNITVSTDWLIFDYAIVILER